MSNEIKTELISEDKTQEYFDRLRILHETTLSTNIGGVDRYATMVAFNEHFYKLRAPDQSILSHVAYIPRLDNSNQPREADALAKLVMTHLSQTNWVATYGLSYNETMQLSYADWIRMQRALNQSKT